MLPKDGVQPWEKLDSNGYVIPASKLHGASAFGVGAQFVPGVERFSAVGSVTDSDECSVVVAGSHSISGGIYRVPLGGVQPSAIAIDANLHPVAGKASQYWVGVSDYGKDVWQWHGPFSEAQVTFTLGKAGNCLSPLGNTFIAITAYDDTTLDIVGLTVSPRDSADTTAPLAPDGLNATPVAGGIELGWYKVKAADLAGCQVYWSYSPFTAPTGNGVNRVPYLENTTHLLLPVTLDRDVYIALSSVDTAGNESALSPTVVRRPLRTVERIDPIVETADASVMRGEPAKITVSGADLYDFDTDGDGDYETTNSSSSTANIDTSATGIIRPRVRAHSVDGKAVAFGSVSLIVSGNQRPVASGHVDPAFGYAPLAVHFTGTGQDFDGTIAEYAWDVDGDGFYDEIDAASATVDYTYPNPGLTNAKLRVTDDQGAWDVDSVSVQALSKDLALSASPSYASPGEPIQLTATAALPVSSYDWDLDGDGMFETTSTSNTDLASFATPGARRLNVRANFTGGGTATAFANVLVNGYVTQTHLEGAGNQSAGYVSMAIVNGNPAIAFHRNSPSSSLMYVRANDAAGTTWGMPVLVDSTSGVGIRPDLEVVNGKPAIASGNQNNGSVSYVQAADTNGDVWKTSVVAGTSITLPDPSLTVVDGRPAISYVGFGVDLKYARANDADGLTWGPETLVSSNGSTGFDSCLAIINGFPAISYYNSTNSVYYVRAIDADGINWGGETLISGSAADSATALVEYAGAPSIFFQASSGGVSSLGFCRAQDASGLGWNPVKLLDGWQGRAAGASISADVVNGLPAVLYRTSAPQDYLVLRGLDAAGLSWTQPETVATYVSGGSRDSLLNIDGRIGVAYFDTDPGVAFALRY